MGKLRPVHLIEALAWLAIAAIFFLFILLNSIKKLKFINLVLLLGHVPSY